MGGGILIKHMILFFYFLWQKRPPSGAVYQAFI